MRLIVARCEVRYTGRLDALLPEALRLIMIKSDGSVMVHADHGGYKPSNWMTPPTRDRGGRRPHRRAQARRRPEDRLDIRIAEVLSDVTHDMGEAAALEKDGVEAHLQELLAEQPHWCGEGFRLVRREWATDIGPVDLMCRDDDDGWIAVEIKRVGTIDAVEQLTRYLERIRARPGDGGLPRRAGGAGDQAAGARARREPRDRLRRGRPRGAARRARAGPDAVRLIRLAPPLARGRRPAAADALLAARPRAVERERQLLPAAQLGTRVPARGHAGEERQRRMPDAAREPVSCASG